MNAELLDPYVLEVMRAGGWNENRWYDTKGWIDELTKEGYICFDYVVEILENLGGLVFNVADACGYKGAQFDFNPYFAAGGEFDRLARFESLAKEGLFPIGSMCAAIVYAGRSKNIYWGSIGRLYWAGTGIEDYLNRLFDKECEPQEKIGGSDFGI